MGEEQKIDHAYCMRSARQSEPLPGLGRVPVTQFLRPNGRQVDVWTDRPTAIAEKAQKLIDAGYRFESEVLTTGHVHVDVSKPDDDGPLANFVRPNGPGVGDAFDVMVEEAIGVLDG